MVSSFAPGGTNLLYCRTDFDCIVKRFCLQASETNFISNNDDLCIMISAYVMLLRTYKFIIALQFLKTHKNLIIRNY